MSTTAQKPATTSIPVQLSEPEFEAFILPHRSMPKRGPRCKLGYYRVFNLILWVLYTGMQWKCLPVPKGKVSTNPWQAENNGTPRHHGAKSEWARGSHHSCYYGVWPCRAGQRYAHPVWRSPGCAIGR